MSNDTPLWKKAFTPPFKVADFSVQDSDSRNCLHSVGCGWSKHIKDDGEIEAIENSFLTHVADCLNNAVTIDSYKWVSTKERMPDENVSVLVFIPEEDNHITAGMWDVSKKWVLLDEYRVPTCEVTYWMYMPPEPEDKSYKASSFRIAVFDELPTMSEQIRQLQKGIHDVGRYKEALRKEIQARIDENQMRLEDFSSTDKQRISTVKFTLQAILQLLETTKP